MTLGERSAPDQVKRPPSGVYAFSEVVDKACEGLMDRQIKFSIRRIQEMEERLCDLERELDMFLLEKDRELI